MYHIYCFIEIRNLKTVNPTEEDLKDKMGFMNQLESTYANCLGMWVANLIIEYFFILVVFILITF